MTAAIITANTGYLLLAFLPPIFWLLFYLREDRHPEPKHLLLAAFLGGMASAGLAVVLEIFVLGPSGGLSIDSATVGDVLVAFAVIALIEEYVKYLPGTLLRETRAAFDEPVDAMIYMMTAALGFAALENALFLLPILHQNVSLGFDIATNRFLGANLLHALSSGIVGFFLARAWFHPHRRHFVALGIIIASLLHTLFNTLILIRDDIPQGTWYLIFLLGIMAMMVFIDFQRLKGKAKTLQT